MKNWSAEGKGVEPGSVCALVWRWLSLAEGHSEGETKCVYKSEFHTILILFLTKINYYALLY